MHMASNEDHDTDAAKEVASAPHSPSHGADESTATTMAERPPGDNVDSYNEHGGQDGASAPSVSTPPTPRSDGAEGGSSCPSTPRTDKREIKWCTEKQHTHADEEVEDGGEEDSLSDSSPTDATLSSSQRNRSQTFPLSPARPPQHASISSAASDGSAGRDFSDSGARTATSMKKRRLFFMFVLGVVSGAWALWRYQHIYPQYFNLPPSLNISSVLPAGLSIGGDVNSTILSDMYGVLSGASTPETYPGLEAAAKNYTAKYPIVLIPGFVTSGLEVWQGEDCASSLFRSRLWGALTMLQTMLMKPDCWTKHMALDMASGLDPPGIRVRAAQGLEAADFFMPGFWVWARLIRDFAAIGYDHSNLALQAYDWRLSLHDMERRDHYFTLLKWKIEGIMAINKEKVVLIAHSYGSNVILYFFAWVESSRGGNGGKNWVERHIATFVNIAGPLLGVVKSASAYVSGEMHDTAELGPLEGILFGQSKNAFHRKNRKRLFRTWGSLTAMLPKGGNVLWGNASHAPEDVEWEMEVGVVQGWEEGGKEGEGEKMCLPHLESETGTFRKDEASLHRAKEESGGMPAHRDHEEAPRAAGAKGGETCVTADEKRRQPVRHGHIFGFTPPVPLSAGSISASAMAVAAASAPPSASLACEGEEAVEDHVRRTAEANSSRDGTSARKPEGGSLQETAFANSSSTPASGADRTRHPPPPLQNWTMDEVIRYLQTDPEDAHLRRRMAEDYDFGPPVKDFKKQKHVKDDPKYWTNPLAVQLPQAPSMRVLCFYGVGKATERAYIYRADDNGKPDVMDISVNDARRNISGGVVMAEGDGTVTLMSLGFHCARLWREKTHNPSKIGVTTRELWHTTGGLLSMRGDGGSADHVDVMGNTKMAADLLKVVSGQDQEEVFGDDIFYSRIREIAQNVEL